MCGKRLETLIAQIERSHTSCARLGARLANIRASRPLTRMLIETRRRGVASCLPFNKGNQKTGRTPMPSLHSNARQEIFSLNLRRREGVRARFWQRLAPAALVKGVSVPNSSLAGRCDRKQFYNSYLCLMRRRNAAGKAPARRLDRAPFSGGCSNLRPSVLRRESSLRRRSSLATQAQTA